ncbi:hypothetical protein PVAND_005328 [Polypedilum vanderplanki]|uniref:LITAF domain-containing protein n=1 Tax=Polypedilum vanderplanki TaxID=319348 RepID=A0A9J6C1R2_POLVA|nr:hypothetical protein PVAND_005328 [Polypedilum vanderplanki]
MDNRTVVVQQSGVSVGPQSTRLTCPSCHAVINSRVEHEASTKTHIIALVLCLLTGCLCCIPYCVDSCKNANHYCPNCQSFLGSYNN